MLQRFAKVWLAIVLLAGLASNDPVMAQDPSGGHGPIGMSGGHGGPRGVPGGSYGPHPSVTGPGRPTPGSTGNAHAVPFGHLYQRPHAYHYWYNGAYWECPSGYDCESWPYNYPYESDLGQYCVTPQLTCVLSSPVSVGASCACESPDEPAIGYVAQ